MSEPGEVHVSVSHLKRSISRETSRIGEHFQVSSCSLSVKEWEETIMGRKLLSSTSEEVRQKLFSKRCLLHQLKTVQYLPLSLAYDEYLAMLPRSMHPKDPVSTTCLKTFVDSILSEENGLPVIIMNSTVSERYMMLYEKQSTERVLKVIDEILTKTKKENKLPGIDDLAGYISGIMNLVCSTREHALILCILSLLLPSTTIRHKFNISEDKIRKFKDLSIRYVECAVDEERNMLESAKTQLEETVKDLEDKLKARTSELKRHTQAGSDEILLENLKQDTKNAEERAKRIKENEKKYMIRMAATKFRTWKENLLRQTGKGKGHYRIDRGAEMAVYKVLQEQLIAHSSRKGKPSVERRLQRKELRHIANKFLKSQGKKLIQSYETVRSWAMPRNKRSVQSNQHRGQGLYCHRKPQKKFVEEHINIHYNRAFVKNYTKFLFSKASDKRYKDFAVRRCLDDKAYLRCGTSEGFSRPANTPIALVNDKATLPAYDFPEKVGYVAPGVNLIIRDMEEVESDGRSKFALNDATISVTCKPKTEYPSTATNWANDIYSDRIDYPLEHELTNTTAQEVQREILSSLILAKDSLRQFCLMTIEDDYLKSKHGGPHLERELLRVSVLISRLLFAYQKVVRSSTLKEQLEEKLLDTVEAAQLLEVYIRSGEKSESAMRNAYNDVCSRLIRLEDVLAGIVPQHRPIDIQTTDAGPGVGTSERMVRLRLCEAFLIHDLDLQCRIHYAPRDSKCHKVEQVMSYLSDAAGDGRHIWPDNESLVNQFTNEELLNMTIDEQNMHKDNMLKETAQKCATAVADKYEGKPAMKTTIHAKVPPNDNPYQHFFFDEMYLKKCIDTSKKAIPECAGYGYFQFLMNKFDEQYIRYDNGVEGIRKDNMFRSPNVVQRIPPPVPDLSTENEKGEWHYHSPSTLPEKFKNAEEREPDDFCPRAQLQSLLISLGPVDLVEFQTKDGVEIKDRNKTWERFTEALPEFIHKYTGQDLEMNVSKEAEKLYLRQLQRQKTSLSRKSKQRVLDEFKTFLVKGSLQMKITKQVQQMPDAVPWNGNFPKKAIEFTNTCTADNGLYFFHALQGVHGFIKEEMAGSEIECLKTLHDVHQLYAQKKYGAGKYMWFSQFKEFSNTRRLWDSYGSEDEYFFSKLWEITSTTHTSACSNASGMCGHPVKIRQSRTLSFSSAICRCKRKFSQRVFVNGPAPLVLPFEISYCPWTSLPAEMVIKGERYLEGLITFGNGGHFTCHINITGTWYRYDCPREYHQPGTGLKRLTTAAKDTPPPGYRRDYVVYYRK